MAIEFPVDPGLVSVFAHSVGDTDRKSPTSCSAPPGTPFVVPSTFARAMIEHFAHEGELWRIPSGESIPEGGSSDRFHAEQHLEYLRPLRAGERLTAVPRPGRTWHKRGRSGPLEFTDLLDVDDKPVVHTRRVGVRVLRGKP